MFITAELCIEQFEAAEEFPSESLYPEENIFNFVLVKLFQQGQPAMTDGSCCMRSKSGHRCAVGWLIPDKDLRPSWRTEVSYNGDGEDAKAVRDYLGRRGLHSEAFATAMQHAHDTAHRGATYRTKSKEWTKTFLHKMRGIAILFDLDQEVINLLENRLKNVA
jgi:hypothetical protein